MTLKACGLEHMIDPDYTIEDPDLHAVQSSWLYKAFQDRITNSIGKGIVSKHIDTMDCQKIWKALCD